MSTINISFSQNTINAQKYYTIEQIKDTLVKYKNPFEAFGKLDLYKIPINEFKKDSFLMKKANDLLNLEFIKDLCYQRKKNITLNWYDEYNKKGFIIKYINKSKNIPYSESKQFYDSIANNKELLNKYFNEALKEKIQKDSIECYSEDEKMTFHYYITFHSRLMTQTSYDTIRSYYDRFYKKDFDEDKYFGGGKYDAVIIALINMGDPEIRAKYDAWFDQKLKKQEIRLNEYNFLTKEIKGSLKYKELAKLLFYDYFVVFDSDGRGIQINGYTIEWEFPFIDTLSYRENLSIQNKMLGKNYSYNDKFGNVLYKPQSSYEEFYQYYMDYVAYLEKKERVLFDKIKYKTKK